MKEVKRYFLDKKLIEESGSTFLKNLEFRKDKKYFIEVNKDIVTENSMGVNDFINLIYQKYEKDEKKNFSNDNITLNFTDKPSKDSIVLVTDPRDKLKYEFENYRVEKDRITTYDHKNLERGFLKAYINDTIKNKYPLDEFLELTYSDDSFSNKIKEDEIYNNQFIKINNSNSLIYKVYPSELREVKPNRYNSYGLYIQRLKECEKNIPNKTLFDMSTRNLRQYLGLEHLLLNDDVEFVILSGGSGSGKTILAYATGIYSVLKKNKKDISKYKNVLILKPNDIVGPKHREIGFLPGEISSKYGPILKSFEDVHNSLKLGISFYDFLKHPLYENEFGKRDKNLYKITGNNKTFLLPQNTPVVELEISNFIRGRTFENKFIIIDEAQNYTTYEMKQILERVGLNCKIVVIGDPYQLDNPILSLNKNGLVYAAHVGFSQKHPRFGLINFEKNYRSQTAELSRNIKIYK